MIVLHVVGFLVFIVVWAVVWGEIEIRLGKTAEQLFWWEGFWWVGGLSVVAAVARSFGL